MLKIQIWWISTQRRVGLLVYKLFDKKISGGAATLALSETLATQNKSAIKNEIIYYKQLVEQLHQLLENLRKEKYTHLL